MDFIIIDNRKSVIEKCQAAGLKAIHGDYFLEAAKIPRHVLVTASNPSFTFGGGIDRQFAYNFPFYCQTKRRRSFVGNERIGNIIFTITVDHKIEANDELVRQALRFAFKNTDPTETLCICALGTGIGLLKEERFLEILLEELSVLDKQVVK